MHTFEKEFGYLPSSHTVVPDIDGMDASELYELDKWIEGELDRLQWYGPDGEGFLCRVEVPEDIRNVLDR